MKDPADDPVNNSNAPEGGYPNLPDDGEGTLQPTMPPLHDYGTTPSNPPSDPPVSQAPITDDNGGHTEGGDVPPADPIPTVTDSQVVPSATPENPAPTPVNPSDLPPVNVTLPDDFEP